MAFHGGAQFVAHDADGLLGLSAGSHSDAYEAVRLQTEGIRDGVLAVGKEFGHAAYQLAVLIHAEPVGLLPGLHFRIGAQRVDLFPGELASGDHHGLDFRAFLVEGRELGALAVCGDILTDQIDSQIRFVGTVFLQCLQVRDAQEGRFGGSIVFSVFGKDGRQHVFQNGEDVLLSGKGHLHVQLIELAGRTVAAGVLIPEAGRDLEIAVDAGDHQQLLELLGCLRQCVELSRMLAGGHQIVSRPFRRGSGEDGRGDLQEPVLGHGLAQCRHHIAPQDDVVLHFRISQIQIAVFQSGGLVRLTGAVHFKGQLVVAAFAQDPDFRGNDLDVTGGDLRVLAVPFPHGAGDLNGGFLVDLLEGPEHLFRIHHDLGGAVEITDDDKCEVLADFPHILHPSCDGDGLADIIHAELAAVMGSGLEHSLFLPLWFSLSHPGSVCPGSSSQVPAAHRPPPLREPVSPAHRCACS